MLQKLFQRIGRWWVVARFHSHVRRNSRPWALGGMFAAAWLALIVAVTLLRTLFGGGPDKWGKVVPVAGRVLLDDGQPLHGGIVKYHADASKGNELQFSPSGEIDADGNYELYTANKKGAPPGWYHVVIAAAETADNSKEARKGSKLPFNVKFTRDDKTPLQVEVKENGDYTLNLTK